MKTNMLYHRVLTWLIQWVDIIDSLVYIGTFGFYYSSLGMICRRKKINWEIKRAKLMRQYERNS